MNLIGKILAIILGYKFMGKNDFYKNIYKKEGYTKRFKVLSFPSLYGTPIKSKNLLQAVIIGVFKRGDEIRIIDKETGEHIVK